MVWKWSVSGERKCGFDGRKKSTRWGRECDQRRRSGFSTFRAAVNAWKRGGTQWSAWSSRAVSACLQVGKGAPGRLYVVSCYAPTSVVSRETKNTFFQEVENIRLAVPQGEKYMLTGDFNACVWSRECEGDLCDRVRGLHRYGLVNDAGKELLSFLSAHQVQYGTHGTWSKIFTSRCGSIWSPNSGVVLISLITCQRDRRMCMDMSARRGADCNIRCSVQFWGWREIAIAHLRQQLTTDDMIVAHAEVGRTETSKAKTAFIEQVLEKARKNWTVDSNVQKIWAVVRSPWQRQQMTFWERWGGTSQTGSRSPWRSWDPSYSKGMMLTTSD